MKLVVLFFLFCSVAFADSNSNLLLFAKNGYEDDLVELLSNHDSSFDINFQNSEGDTAFHLAVKENRAEILKILLNAYPTNTGIKLNLKNNNGETALYTAVKSGHIESMKLLIQAQSIYKIDLEAGPNTVFGTHTPLVLASEMGNDELASFLIQSGASTNVMTNSFSDGLARPLLFYISVDSELQMTLKEFVKVNKKVNIRTESNSTPLMEAASSGLLENVKTLVGAGALVNLRDNAGNTALHLTGENIKQARNLGDGALYSNSLAIFDFLVSAGANTDYKNEEGKVPFRGGGIFACRVNCK